MDELWIELSGEVEGSDVALPKVELVDVCETDPSGLEEACEDIASLVEEGRGADVDGGGLELGGAEDCALSCRIARTVFGAEAA